MSPFAVRSGAVTLAGALSVPGTVRAAVVMVGGSGASDRDNDGYFPPIRDHLVTSGIAVAGYDKRGVGGSTGDWRSASIADLAGDAAAAADALRAHVGPGIPLGLYGHSEGGWVVLRAAAATAADFVVTNSCPGMSPSAQDRYGLANVLRTDGIADREVDETLASYDALVELGRHDAGFAEASALLAGSPELRARLGDLDEASWAFLKRKQDHDPLPDAASLRCRWLALFGAADPLVPVADSVAAFARTTCDQPRAAPADVTMRLFPNADHRIQTTGGVLAPGYLAALADWILDGR